MLKNGVKAKDVDGRLVRKIMEDKGATYVK
jgi:hypothetical protein